MKDNFDQIYIDYSAKVLGKCLSFTNGNTAEAEDLTHDIFIKIFFSLKDFKENSSISTWIYRITFNHCVDYSKKSSKSKELFNYDVPDVIDEIDDEDLFQIKVNQLKILLELISADDKSILLLKYQDDQSIKNICKIMDLKESAVKMKLSRAKFKVKNLYDEKFN